MKKNIKGSRLNEKGVLSKKGFLSLAAGLLVLALFLGGFSGLPVTKADIADGKYTYVVTDGIAATLTGYAGVASIVNIPVSLGGYPVTSIGDNAFKGHTEIVSLSIPDGVVSIGAYAFYGCSGLAKVTVGKNVATINTSAFSGTSGWPLTGCSIYFAGNAPLTSKNAFPNPSLGAPTIYYKSGTTGWTNPWNGCPTVLERDKFIAVLQVGNTRLTVNDVVSKLDAAPVLKNSTCYVPIRAIIEAFGGIIAWNSKAQRTTITLGGTTVDLWIGKNTAAVNGKSKLIDATNAKIVPIILEGRTMLPLRFVTESLGCEVNWNAATKTVTITYTLE